VPIPGTTKQHRLEENIGAADIALTLDNLGAIAAVLSTVTVLGDRYPAHLQARSAVERLTAARVAWFSGHTRQGVSMIDHNH
jgi:hypothetical protein